MKENYDFRKAKRGAVLGSPAGKTRITIRIDDAILDWFRRAVHEAGGGNYQTQINDALRQHIFSEEKPLEDTLRRVLREELPSLEKRREARVRNKVSAKKSAKKKTRARQGKAKSKIRKKTATRRKRA